MKKPLATKHQFYKFYKKYDEDGDGQIDKEEMTKFIKEYLKNPPNLFEEQDYNQIEIVARLDTTLQQYEQNGGDH